MRDAKAVLDRQFLEMRWRCLALAADLDRVEHATGGKAVLDSDPRLQQLREALVTLNKPGGQRAEQVQLILSDKTPPPR